MRNADNFLASIDQALDRLPATLLERVGLGLLYQHTRF